MNIPGIILREDNFSVAVEIDDNLLRLTCTTTSKLGDKTYTIWLSKDVSSKIVDYIKEHLNDIH